MSNGETIVVFGATSAVAQSLIKLHASNGDGVILVARNSDHLKIIADDIKAKYNTSVSTMVSDLADISEHEPLVESLRKISGDISRYYFFYGVLPDQKECEQSIELTLAAINTNFLSKISLLNLLANKIEKEGERSLVVVSSVAGDRGRQSNYVYGTSKGALSIYLQGLRNRLSKANCHVVTVKPGFIDTPMTADFDKGGLLWASPDTVAKDIYKASLKNKDIIYSPWFWRYIMLIIKLIPERIFKKLNL